MSPDAPVPDAPPPTPEPAGSRPSGRDRSRATRLRAVYLRDHASAARAGADLFARMASSQARRSWGPELASLAADVDEDRRALMGLLRDVGVSPDPWLTLAARAGERVGRLKPNGHLLSRSPLSDLLEVEGGLDAVHAKLAGWRALRAATLRTSVDLAGLERRAQDELDRLAAIHQRVAAAVL